MLMWWAYQGFARNSEKGTWHSYWTSLDKIISQGWVIMVWIITFRVSFLAPLQKGQGKWSRVQKELLSPDVVSETNQSHPLRSKGESPSICCRLKNTKRGIKNCGEFKKLGLLQAPGKQFSKDPLAARYLGLFNYRPLMITHETERGGGKCQQWKWQKSYKLAWESATWFPP